MIKTIFILDMAPYYEYICNELQMAVDQNLLTKMKEANKTEIEKLEEAVKDAEENLGEIEIRDTKIAKAEYLSKIGDKVNCPVGSALQRKFEADRCAPQKLGLVRAHSMRIGSI